MKEKNIIKKDIKGETKVVVGDKDNTDNNYERKNIIEGNVIDCDKLIIGYGY